MLNISKFIQQHWLTNNHTQGSQEKYFRTLKHSLFAGKKNLRLDQFEASMFEIICGVERHFVDCLAANNTKLEDVHDAHQQTPSKPTTATSVVSTDFDNNLFK